MLEVKATDYANTVQTVISSVAFTVDNTAPNLYLSQPTTNFTYWNTLLTISGTANDNSFSGIISSVTVGIQNQENNYWWDPVSDPSAQNTNGVDPSCTPPATCNPPGPVSWSTTDAVTIQRMVFGPQKYISFSIVPVAVNGTGTNLGQVALKDARVTVKYKLCIDTGDCP